MLHLVPPPRRWPEVTGQRLEAAEGYEALFAGALAHLPGSRDARLRAWREASFERFRTLGFPGPKAEAWKYTSLRPIARERFALPAPVDIDRAALAPYLLQEPDALRLVFLNGVLASHLSDDVSAVSDGSVQSFAAALEGGSAADLDESDEERSFTALNAALASDGGIIRVAENARLPGPVQLLFVSLGQDQPAIVSPRNLIELGAGARLDLVETHLMIGSSRPLTNLVNRVIVGRGAELNHDRLQVGDPAGQFIGKTFYQVSADVRLTQTLATLGGAMVRNEVEAVLEGSGIALQLNGLYLTRGRQHVDNAIQVEHAAPNSTSDQFYKGVLDERGRAVFAGRILVQRVAQKTNAYQNDANLLLSPDAEIDTKPELEIFADDVKCSHGATAGELDERELFYLRSRGLDPAMARSLLTFAFADEVVERFSNPEAARHAKREVLRWLPGGPSLEDLS
jgi:Fe-S cluster assembly protein SufD